MRSITVTMRIGLDGAAQRLARPEVGPAGSVTTISGVIIARNTR